MKKCALPCFQKAVEDSPTKWMALVQFLVPSFQKCASCWWNFWHRPENVISWRYTYHPTWAKQLYFHYPSGNNFSTLLGFPSFCGLVTRKTAKITKNPENKPKSKRKVVSQSPFFRGYVSFRGLYMERLFWVVRSLCFFTNQTPWC